jgi:peptide deformylase
MDKILKITKYPEKILRKRSQSVEKITEKEMYLFKDMLYTMHRFSGIGLAAPQIGIDQRLIVADVGEGPVKLANPEVIQVKGKDKMGEGCLSVPNVMVEIERPDEIIVKGVNEQGKTVELKARGLLARVLLHEIDHLKGKLIIDYMGFLQKVKFNFNNIERKRQSDKD